MVSNKCFNQVMQGLQILYNTNLNDFVLKIYKRSFDDNFTDETLMIATNKIIDNRVYPTFPKPAEFLEIMKCNDISIEDELIIAIHSIRKAIKKYGAYKSLCFEDYKIHVVIRNTVGSWVKLCRMDLEEFEKYLTFEFPKSYKAISNKFDFKELSLYLKGIEEHKNVAFNLVNEIKYLGNKEKIVKWQKTLLKKDGNKINIEEKINLGFVENVEKIENETNVKNIILEKSNIEKIISKFKVTEEEEERNENSKEELFEKIKEAI
jgi:hypothetical protein